MHLLVWIAFLLSPLSAQYYVVSTVVGNGSQQAQIGSGSPTAVRLVSPRFVAADGAGNVFFADTYFNQVFRVSPQGQLSNYAGAGGRGSSGDGGPATAALLNNPAGLAVDSFGNLYISDNNNGRIRRVTPAGVISTFLVIPSPSYLAFKATGELFISQPSLNTISRLPVGATTAVPFAGTGTVGFSGDNGPALSARFSNPQGICFDSAGNLFVADTSNHRIRRIGPNGTITTIAGDGVARLAGDDGPALSASFASPGDVAVDANGNLYIADTSNGLIRIVSPQGRISRYAGGGTTFADGPLSSSLLPEVSSIALDNRGSLLAAESWSRQIRRLASGLVSTVAGTSPSNIAEENIPPLNAQLFSPGDIAFDSSGNLYFSDSLDNRVRRIGRNGLVTTFAGNGIFGSSGNGGPALSAQFGSPFGLAFDPAGNLFVGTRVAFTVRRIAPSGVISNFAGGNNGGSSGDGGAAIRAQLFNPIGLATDSQGNLFIADTNNFRIRRVDAVTQVISTFAGTGQSGFSGDGGPASQARISSPRYLAFDRAGNLLFTDVGNRRIRRITPAGIISTIAGTGGFEITGDGGPAVNASIGFAAGIAVDASSNIFFSTDNRIRRITPAGIISTIAGTGVAGFSGESSLATNANLDNPLALAIDPSGAILFVDQGNFRIRKLTPSPIVAEGITNGASLRVGPVAPGQIISIFGFDLGPTPAVGLQLDTSGKVANSLGGTQVLFDGVPAPLLFVSSGQVNAVVPYAVSGKSTVRVQLQINGRVTGSTALPVTATSPGLFAITNQDGSLNTASNAAAPGSVLILYGTGEGQTIPAGVDGNVANSVFPKPLQEMTVTIGGRPATVLYAGAAPGFVSGVFQLNVTIPAGLSGTLPLQVKVGETTTPAGSNITVR